MRSFGISIKGRTKNFTLPKSQPLIPLFEAIVNSFHSIEERKKADSNFKDGHIYIEMERDGQISIDGEGPLPEIINMIVIDNGSGFNENNFSSFLESDSTYKEAIGGKGVGRFSWLHAFEKAEIESIYVEENVPVKRSFIFSLASNEINDSLIDADNYRDNRTSVKLSGFLNPYRTTAPKQLATIATRILHHCLIYFMDEECPKVVLKDEYESIDLNALFRERIKTDDNSEVFDIDGNSFELLHVKAEDPSVKGNSLFLCAHNRLVETKDLDKYIVDLDRSIYEKHGFYYIGVLRGRYLDENVDMNRLSFSIPEGGIAPSLIGVTSIDEILSMAVNKINVFLSEFLEPISNAKQDTIKNYVINRAPQFRHLLKYMPSDILGIKPNLSEDKLDDELYRIKRIFDKQIKQQNEEILSLLETGVISQEEYTERFQKQITKVSEANSAVLAEYIAHRKVIIDLLQIAIRRKEDGVFHKESYIHDLIYPMHTSSDDMPYDCHNLWLLDEKLAYCSYISSDIPFNNDRHEERTDIMILDHPVAVSEGHNDGTEFDTIVIFEIKRPMRDDYTDASNPIVQLYGYVDKIKTNKMKDKDGRIIHVGENTKFYLYAICDVTPNLEKVLRHGGIFKKTPDKLGYYGYNDSYNAYVEVLPFDKVINDSQKRNRVLFEKLGL